MNAYVLAESLSEAIAAEMLHFIVEGVEWEFYIESVSPTFGITMRTPRRMRRIAKVREIAPLTAREEMQLLELLNKMGKNISVYDALSDTHYEIDGASMREGHMTFYLATDAKREKDD